MKKSTLDPFWENICFLFDIDGVLIASSPTASRIFMTTIQQYFSVEESIDSLRARSGFASGDTDFGFFASMVQQKEKEQSLLHPVAWEEFTHLYEKNLAEFIQQDRQQHPTVQHWEALPSVKETLAFVRQITGKLPGFFTGNTWGGAKQKLDYIGVWDEFNPLISQSARPGIYDKCDFAPVIQTWVENSSVNLILVGDTPKDIQLAHDLGAFSVGVATGRYSLESLQSTQPDFAIPNLAVFLETWDSLERKIREKFMHQAKGEK